MLKFPSCSGKETARAGGRIWCASAGLDDDGTRVTRQEQHRDDDQGKDKAQDN
jgi:hypothetical protein